MRLRIQAVLLTLVAAAAPVAAQWTSQARGTVLDPEGNPIVGAVVTLAPASNPTMTYPGKTNKKGRYFISGLYTARQDDRWSLTIKAEGYVPTVVRVEARTVNKVLIGDIRTKTLRPGAKLPQIAISPSGTAIVDFTLTPEDQVGVAGAAPAAAPDDEKGAVARPAAAPRRIDAWTEALTRAQDGDLEGAVAQFDKAVEKEPEDPERRAAYAKVLYQLERFDDAEVQASEAVALAPDLLGPHMVLYSIYISQGNLAQARDALDAARESDPENIGVLKQFAFLASQEDDAESEISAHEAITVIDPTEVDSWVALGDLYARTGEAVRSEQAYQKVTELDPDNAHQVFFNLGALMISSNDRTQADTRKAIQAFREALRIKPDYAEAYKQLAFALLNTGDRTAAKQSLESYIKYAPRAPDAARMQQLISSLQE